MVALLGIGLLYIKDFFLLQISVSATRPSETPTKMRSACGLSKRPLQPSNHHDASWNATPNAVDAMHDAVKEHS